MKRNLMSVALVGLLTVAVAAMADVPEAVKKEIGASYVKMNAAMKAKQVHAVMSIAHSKMTYTQMGKTSQRGELEALLTQNFAQLKSIDKLATKIGKMEMKGADVVAQVTDTMEATIVDPQGKTHKFKSNGKSTDIWSKEKGAWKVKSIVVTSSEEFMDGKKVGAPGKP